MSLETVDDAKRLIGLSRAEYDALLAYLQRLPAEGWTEQSACTDWKVYQVASHLGSGPQIMTGLLQTLRGAEPMTDEQRRAVWAYFDNLQPSEMLSAFRRTNDEYFEQLESLTDDELGRTVNWIFGEVPVAVPIVGRLNEQALHAWDIRWARDNQSRLSPDAVPDMLQYDLRPQAVARLTRPERAERLVGKTIRFEHSQPEGALLLAISADGATVGENGAGSADLTVELPSEALIRLIWGRYEVQAGHDSGELKLSDPDLVDSLQALFPGR